MPDYDKMLRDARHTPSDAASPILAWPTKLLLICAVLGAGGFYGYKYYRSQFPATINTGIIGDELLQDGVILCVYDVETRHMTDTGVDLYLVSTIIGNGSKKPMSAPNVAGLLYDQYDAEYAPNQQKEKKPDVDPINPRLCYIKILAFIVPSSVEFRRLEATLPTGGKFTVDITKRTAANEAMTAAANQQNLKGAAQDFGDTIEQQKPTLPKQQQPQEKQNQPHKPNLEPLSNLIDRSKETGESAAAKIQTLTAQLPTAQATVQKADKRVKSMENLVHTSEAAVDRYLKAVATAQDNVNKLNALLRQASQRESIRIQNDLNRAQADLDLQQSRLDDARAELKDRQGKASAATIDAAAAHQDLSKISTELQKLSALVAELVAKIDDAQKKIDATNAPPAEVMPAVAPKTDAPVQLPKFGATPDAHSQRHTTNPSDP
jgi:hypothetical protein